MAVSSLLQLFRETDRQFLSIFMTEWGVMENEVAPLVRERDLAGRDYDRYSERYLGTATAPISHEGSPYTYISPNEGKSVEILTDIYQFGMKVTEEMRDFGRGGWQEYPRIMAEVYNHTKVVMVLNLLNRAFNSAYPTLYDAKELCATDHPIAAGGTASNELATPADLAEATVEALVELMQRTPNEDGVLINRFRPRLLITSPATWGANVRLTQSQFTTDVSNSRGDNTVNAITSVYGIQTFTHPYLQDADASWLLDTERSPLEVIYARRPTIKPGYIEQGTDNWVWTSKMQLAVKATEWRGIVGTAGAA